MPRLRLVLLAGTATLAACIPVVRKRPAAAPAVAPVAANAPNTAGPWRIPAPTGFHKVAIVTQATVAISSDTSVRTDTLQATLGASYTWTGLGRRKVDGLLTDYRVAVGGAIPAVPAGLQLSRPFAAEAVSGSELAFRLPLESSACTDPTLSAVQGLQDAWIPLPETLTMGREWTDTVHTLSCRDRVPLRGTSVRRFQARRADVEGGSRVLVIIERTARGRLEGQGEQFGEQVAIEGTSTGSMRYTLDVVTGQLVRATGTGSLTFSLKSKRRNQVVRQASTVTMAWVP